MARAIQAHETDEESVLAELGRYDPRDAGLVSDWIRTHASFQNALDSWLALYDSALEAWECPDLRAAATDPAKQSAAVSQYLVALSAQIRKWEETFRLLNEHWAVRIIKKNVKLLRRLRHLFSRRQVEAH